MERQQTDQPQTQTQTQQPQAEQVRAAPAQPEPQPQPEAERSQEETTTRNQPVDTLRDGRVRVSIWRNETENGPMHSASFSRSYRDQDGQFRDSHSFAGADLLRLSELARETYTRTNALQREARRAETDQQDDERRAEFKRQREGAENREPSPDRER